MTRTPSRYGHDDHTFVTPGQEALRERAKAAGVLGFKRGQIAPAAVVRLVDEIERLRTIEAAALRFIKEADDRPRYISVRTWATSEADPYLNLRAVLGLNNQQQAQEPT